MARSQKFRLTPGCEEKLEGESVRWADWLADHVLGSWEKSKGYNYLASLSKWSRSYSEASEALTSLRAGVLWPKIDQKFGSAT